MRESTRRRSSGTASVRSNKPANHKWAALSLVHKQPWDEMLLKVFYLCLDIFIVVITSFFAVFNENIFGISLNFLFAWFSRQWSSFTRYFVNHSQKSKMLHASYGVRSQQPPWSSRSLNLVRSYVGLFIAELWNQHQTQIVRVIDHVRGSFFRDVLSDMCANFETWAITFCGP